MLWRKSSQDLDSGVNSLSFLLELCEVGLYADPTNLHNYVVMPHKSTVVSKTEQLTGPLSNGLQTQIQLDIMQAISCSLFKLVASMKVCYLFGEVEMKSLGGERVITGQLKKEESRKRQRKKGKLGWIHKGIEENFKEWKIC